MSIRRIVLSLVCWMLFLIGIGVLQADESTTSPKERIERLIEQLGSPEYHTREHAQNKLAEFGFEAFDLLEAASTHDDLEIATRARYLLRLIRVSWTQKDDPPEVKKFLDRYEFQSMSERVTRIEGLSKLGTVAGLQALCRVIRFEKSAILSKYAALAALECQEPYQTNPSQTTEMLHHELKKTPRPGAKWLLVKLKMLEDPKKTLPEWKQLVDEELGLFSRSSETTSSAIVTTLLYRLAQYQAEVGEDEVAEKTAQRARGLNAGRNEAEVITHFRSATNLRTRGLYKWADLEYRHIVRVRPDFALLAFRSGSEMWHDQGQSLRAADMLKECIEIGKTRSLTDFNLSESNARRHYFLSRHFEKQGDRTKQREHLDEAIKNDPSEIDVLIARYRLKERTPEFHQKTLELIQKTASNLRKGFRLSTKQALSFNQFAWLISNTEGDLDEALSCSKKSIALSPDSGAYYDTLGRVYYARGDFENAVKSQAKAVKLEPHSGLIAKQYKLFCETLKKEQAEKDTPKTEPPVSPTTST